MTRRDERRVARLLRKSRYFSGSGRYLANPATTSWGLRSSMPRRPRRGGNAKRPRFGVPGSPLATAHRRPARTARAFRAPWYRSAPCPLAVTRWLPTRVFGPRIAAPPRPLRRALSQVLGERSPLSLNLRPVTVTAPPRSAVDTDISRQEVSRDALTSCGLLSAGEPAEESGQPPEQTVNHRLLAPYVQPRRRLGRRISSAALTPRRKPETAAARARRDVSQTRILASGRKPPA
jgi:hypothetical protein